MKKYILFLLVAFVFVQCDPVTTTQQSDSTTDVSNQEATTDGQDKSTEVEMEESIEKDNSLTDSNPTENASVEPETYKIAFYNVENLFDTEDDPNKNDEDFLPNGRQKWDNERYNKKLNRIDEVITAMDYPDVIGFCEVENKKVLEDLIDKTSMSNQGYKVVHHESNDHRGIDVALIYKTDKFEYKGIDTKIINIPEKLTGIKGYSTRDLFHAKLQASTGDMVHFYVNHWPSRRGGLAASSPKREYVAKQVRSSIDAVQSKDADAKIILMGDFNDEPNNKSIAEVLNAKAENTSASSELINVMADLEQGLGTYSYKGNWNMLDQFILSDVFFEEGTDAKFEDVTIFKEEFMLYKGTPNRTYGGPNYYGGYSDHLPIYMFITLN